MDRLETLEEMIREAEQLGWTSSGLGERTALSNFALLLRQLLDSFLEYSAIVKGKAGRIRLFQLPVLQARMQADLEHEVDEYMKQNLGLLQDYQHLFSSDDFSVEVWQKIYSIRSRFLDELKDGLLNSLSEI